jgi:pimeloyl-ACP methyl ester carboxylesterase
MDSVFMNRRRMLRALGSLGVASAVAGFRLTAQTRKIPNYEAHGNGPALILGLDQGLTSALENGYVERLRERYRVIVMDYPPGDDDARFLENSFTPDHVCSDILAVADAAGAGRFAWFGYSWGAVVGLQLATRTERLTALICGGWPPLGAPYGDMARVAGAIADRAGKPKIWATFYRALEQWPEHDAVSKIRVPRMTFAGSKDVIVTDGMTARIGPLVAEHSAELQSMGWVVRVVDNFAHELVAHPEVVTPLIRDFLDPVLLHA